MVMTERARMAMVSMMVGSLRYYAGEAECDGEAEVAGMLRAIADHIADGTATEEEWLEAISQCDMSE